MANKLPNNLMICGITDIETYHKVIDKLSDGGYPFYDKWDKYHDEMFERSGHDVCITNVGEPCVMDKEHVDNGLEMFESKLFINQKEFLRKEY